MMIFGKWKRQHEFNEMIQKQMSSMDSSLRGSFDKVKNDVVHVQKWISYLHASQDKLIKKTDEMAAKIGDMLSKEEVQYLVDEYYHSLDKVNTSMSNFQQQTTEHLRSIYGYQANIFQRLEELSSKDPTPQIQAQLTLFKEEMEDMVASKVEKAIKEDVFDKLERLNLRIDNLHIASQPKIEKPIEAAPVQVSEVKTARQYLKEKIFRKVTRHSKDYVRSMLLSLIKKYGKISGLNLREIVVEEQGILSKSSLYRLLNEIETDENIEVVQDGKEKHYFWKVQSPNIQS